MMMRHMNFRAPFLENLVWTVLPALLVLIIGALINKIIAAIQGALNANTNKWGCTGFFALQVIFNVFILLVLARKIDSFVVWLQLTVSGIVAAILFFVVQTRIGTNANCILGET